MKSKAIVLYSKSESQKATALGVFGACVTGALFAMFLVHAI